MIARHLLLLDGCWRFQLDRDEKGESRGYHTSGYQPVGWLEVPVPGNWDAYRPELFGYAGHAWYRCRFRAEQAWRGARLHLRFEGANYESTVWLNGQLAGSHSGGFDPFAFDVTDLVEWEAENTLAVRVDNWPRIGRVPNSFSGWWNYGGIYRSVRLLALPPVRIAKVFVHAEPGEGATASLAVEATVVNEGAQPAEVALVGDVTGGQGPAALAGPLSVGPIVVAAGAEVKLSCAAVLADAKLWSPGEPNLYTLHLALQQPGVTLDSQDTNFGVRRFEVRGTQLLLNGAPAFLTGFNRHEEYTGTGRVDPGGALEADLRLIQDLNGNTVRMHYQAHPDLYDLCDRLGLLVFAEIPLWGVGNKDVAELSDPGLWQVAETMLRTLITSLRNHPSVVIWSVGNECATHKEEARPLIAHLVEVARSLDSTRPIAYVGCFDTDEKCFDLVDLPCINKYMALSDGFGARLDAIHALQPSKPLLVTEFGHESVLGLHGEGYGTEEEHAQVLEKKVKALRERRSYVPAAIVWCLADYWHMPMGPDFHWFNRIYFCHGVTTLARQLKLAAEAIKRAFGAG